MHILGRRRRGERVFAADVPGAYYQVPLKDRIFLRIPDVGVYRATHVIPGLKEGAKLWLDYATSKLEDLGYVQKAAGFYEKADAA